MSNDNVFIRYIEFPYSVRACTLPNNDGTFDIYINSRLSETAQEKALKHELKHIQKNHFYNDIKTIAEVEEDAEHKTA